jgi:hypothetical protein
MASSPGLSSKKPISAGTVAMGFARELNSSYRLVTRERCDVQLVSNIHFL